MSQLVLFVNFALKKIHVIWKDKSFFTQLKKANKGATFLWL